MGTSTRRPGGRAAFGRPDAPRPADVVQDSRGFGRETVESIVVAFALALVFKAFEAEAFVIPTGSMAPTLMGRHKDLICDACHATFQVGCSREVDEAAGRVNDGLTPTRGDCPNCGRVKSLDRGAIPWHDPQLDSFNGDRILVDKISYDFRNPSRWDVVVFKYPEDAKTNYIKRLVGLPGETVTIAGGDIWISRDGEPPRIARKPPDTLVAMLQCVSDSRYVPESLIDGGWPTAWIDWSDPAGAKACAWTTADSGRSFEVSCPGDAQAMLRFRRLLPDEEAWSASAVGAGNRTMAAVIGDFQAYNECRPRRPANIADDVIPVDGAHWVGDLAVEVDLESRAPAGVVTLDLVESGVVHSCSIDLADGTATLMRSAGAGGLDARARTGVRGRGRWRLLFANVDDELSLFVDGRRVTCDRPTAWTHAASAAVAARPVAAGGRPGDAAPGDLAPAGVTVRGADVRLSRLRVLRDVYYIALRGRGPTSGSFDERDEVAFPLTADQFFMLGDNSAASADSRLWQSGHHVDRHLIVGRALAVFWPHGVPTGWSVPLKIGTWELRLPFLPNFARIRFVR